MESGTWISIYDFDNHGYLDAYSVLDNHGDCGLLALCGWEYSKVGICEDEIQPHDRRR
jgi:hypothetical protein